MRIFYFTTFLLSALIGSQICFAQVEQEWVALAGGPANDDDYCNDIALDPWGNVVVTGFITGINTGYDLLTIKYNPDGDTLWTYYYHCFETNNDKSFDVDIDDEGFIYVVGYSYGETSMNVDYLTIKLDPEGNLIWMRLFDGPNSLSDYAFEIEIGSDGSVYVSGYTHIDDTDRDYLTVKYSSQGDSILSRTYGGPNSEMDFFYDMVVDHENSIIVTGVSYGESTQEWATVKYDSAGNEVWANRYADPFTGIMTSECSGIDVDSHGNVYVTGWTNQEIGYNDTDCMTIKYSASGDLLWDVNYNGPAGQDDYARDIIVDHENNIYIIGEADVDTVPYFDDFDFLALKYDTAGTLLWARTLEGFPDMDDWALYCTIDDANSLYIAGETNNNTSTDEIRTVKYDASGNLLWSISYVNTADGFDNPGELVVDSLGNVYQSGHSCIGYGYDNSDYITIKYSQTPFDVSVDLTYQSGSPVPSTGGNLYFDVFVENYGTVPVDYDAWLETSYEGGIPVTVVQRSFTNYQPGWTINRPNSWFPVPATYAGGNYTLTGKVGQHPNNAWDESSFPFVKSGTFAPDFKPFKPDNMPDPFDMIDAEQSLLPSSVALTGAYPNPFNPSTTVSFALPAAARVHLSVYDVSGRLVQTLVDGHRQAGYHEALFDASHLASGIYFVHLETNQYTGIQKLVLMK